MFWDSRIGETVYSRVAETVYSRVSEMSRGPKYFIFGDETGPRLSVSTFEMWK